MSGEGIFHDAIYQALERKQWLFAADDEQHFRRTRYTRRQCLLRARRCEGRIVDLSIKAEWGGRHFQIDPSTGATA